MDLIKVGDFYINARHITDVMVHADPLTVTVYLAAPESAELQTVSTRYRYFSGAEALALIAWLDRRAAVIA